MSSWKISSGRLAAFALFALSLVAVVEQSSRVEATVTVPAAFRTIRAVVNSDGTIAYGGAGMTVTYVSGTESIDSFPAETWINAKTSKLCDFVPMVSTVGSYAPNETWARSVVENTDGSGTIDVVAGGQWSLIAESANC